MPTFTNQFPGREHDCPNQRVRLYPAPASPREVQGAGHCFPLVHRPLEAHSQAQAGEELSFGGIEVLEIGRELPVRATLIPDLSGESDNRQVHPRVEETYDT